MSIFSNLLLFAILLFCFNLSFARDEKTVKVPHQSQRQHSHTKHMVQIVANQHKKKEKKPNNGKEHNQFMKKNQAQNVLKADLNSNFVVVKERQFPYMMRRNITRIDRN